MLSGRRGEFILVTKGGMFRNAQGQREIDGRAEMIRKNCEESLQRLKTDVIDVYYLHRWDKRLPIEESVGALADLVKEGKVRTIGLSEVSATTLRRAHAVHPITALQTEYSLWTRNAEVAVLDTCRELGIAFVAFSPLARGLFGGQLRDVSTLPPKDIRLAMPRFQGEHFAQEPLAAGRLVGGRSRGRLHDGASSARMGAGPGPAHHSDSGHDAARSSRRERTRGAGAPLPRGNREAERADQPIDRLRRRATTRRCSRKSILRNVGSRL